MDKDPTFKIVTPRELRLHQVCPSMATFYKVFKRIPTEFLSAEMDKAYIARQLLRAAVFQWYKNNNPPPIKYLKRKWGGLIGAYSDKYNLKDLVYEQFIPISECIERLYDENWQLIYPASVIPMVVADVRYNAEIENLFTDPNGKLTMIDYIDVSRDETLYLNDPTKLAAILAVRAAVEQQVRIELYMGPNKIRNVKTTNFFFKGQDVKDAIRLIGHMYRLPLPREVCPKEKCPYYKMMCPP